MRLLTGPTGLLAQSVGVLAIWLTARETTALSLVVVSLLFFRAFRKRYLLVWAAGWMAYTALLFLERLSAWRPGFVSLAAYAQADFVLATGLFATAALVCAQSRRGLMIFAAVGWVVLVCAAMRPIYFPESTSAQLSLEVACRLLAAAVAIKFLLSRPGRTGLGQVLFGVGLVTLNLNWQPYTAAIPTEGYLLAEILFGSSMFLVVLDESRVRTRRLAVLTELSATIARGSSHATILQTALGKLSSSIDAKAAWFHVLEGTRFTPTQHVGLSTEGLRVLAQAGVDETLARTIRETRAIELAVSAMTEEARQMLAGRGIREVILVPAVGKESSIGVIAFGCRRVAADGIPEELEFLETAAQKLGIAAENLKLSSKCCDRSGSGSTPSIRSWI